MRHTTAAYRVTLEMVGCQGWNRETDERFDISDPQGTVYVMANSPRDIYTLFGECTVKSVERIGVGYVLVTRHANGGMFSTETQEE